MTDTTESRWERHNEAGRRHFAQGELAQAEQAFIAAIREATLLGAENLRLATSLSNLGQLKYKQKDLTQSETLFRRALSIRERLLGLEHYGIVQSINNLAALYYARGELNQAEPLFLRALAISEQHLGAEHPDVSVCLNNLARLYFRRNEFAAAAPLLLRLLAIKERALGGEHPEVAGILSSLVRVRQAERQYDAAEQLCRRVLAIRERAQPAGDISIATSLDTLGDICSARGRHEEELEARERALTIRVQALGPDNPSVQQAQEQVRALRVRIPSRTAQRPPVAASTSTSYSAPPVAPPLVRPRTRTPLSGMIAGADPVRLPMSVSQPAPMRAQPAISQPGYGVAASAVLTPDAILAMPSPIATATITPPSTYGPPSTYTPLADIPPRPVAREYEVEFVLPQNVSGSEPPIPVDGMGNRSPSNPSVQNIPKAQSRSRWGTPAVAAMVALAMVVSVYVLVSNGLGIDAVDPLAGLGAPAVIESAASQTVPLAQYVSVAEPPTAPVTPRMDTAPVGSASGNSAPIPPQSPRPSGRVDTPLEAVPATAGAAVALPSRSALDANRAMIDRVTRAVEDSARVAADSVGRQFNVRPPSFNRP